MEKKDSTTAASQAGGKKNATGTTKLPALPNAVNPQVYYSRWTAQITMKAKSLAQ